MPFWLLGHGIAWGVFLALLIFGAARVEPIFADFGLPLPNVTLWAIDASHRVVACAMLILLLLVVDRLVHDALWRRGDVLEAWWWALLMTATPLLMVAATLWALLLPFLNLHRLSG